MHTGKSSSQRHRILKSTFVVFALMCLILALIDLVTQVTPAIIAEGQPFWYWGYVNQHLRPYAVLVGMVLAAAWGFLRPAFNTLRIITMPTVLLLLCSCTLLSLVVPLMTLTHTAVHMQSQSHDGKMYHLFYQSEGAISTECAYVLVACDNLGMSCQYQHHWQVGPICMGENAPIQLNSSGVIIDTETVWTWPPD